jgi:hypothetical protein
VRAELAITPSAQVSYEIVRIGKSDVDPVAKNPPGATGSWSTYADVHSLDNTFWHYVEATLRLSARINDRLSASFGYSTFGGVSNTFARYLFGNVDKPPFVLTAGFFNYSYAPEVQDLGEYLFKTGVYPRYIVSGYEGYDLLGLWLRSDAVPALRQDLLITSEINVFPNYDYSVSYLAHLSYRDAFVLGAGVMFYRLLSVDPANTYPDKVNHGQFDERTGTQKAFYHPGTKTMARCVLDPKKLLSSHIFGENDLKLYAEAALLGVKGYPTVYEDSSDTEPRYYEEWWERAPVMAGVMLPTFKLLDVLAVEVEWYGSPYNNTNVQTGQAYPNKSFNADEYRHRNEIDDWKWAVSVQKTVMEGFVVSARAGRDHLRQKDTEGNLALGTGWFKPHEVMVLPEHWYASLKFTLKL